MIERLFIVIKDDNKIICTSKSDTNYVVVFIRDENGFYVYTHFLKKQSMHICNSSPNLMKRSIAICLIIGVITIKCI